MRQHLLLWIIRGIFLLTIIGLATGTALSIQGQAQEVFKGGAGPGELSETARRQAFEAYVFSWVVLFATLILGVGIAGLDLFLKDKQITTLSAIYFGLLLGLLFGHLFSSAVVPLLKLPMDDQRWSWLMEPARALIILTFCYVCVSTLLQTKDDFRFIIPYVEFSKQVKGGKPLVLDTSVIIDGRIADICDTRIIDTQLVVPRFVLQELQTIADSPDKLKRNRGRRGMDMLKRMQSNPKVDLVLHEANLAALREVNEVDQRLVVLAKALGARVVTNDFNLNKIAQLQGVEVINLNELANALKSVALPGENLHVRLIKPGDQVGQGVGYLDDGTMVVAEQGRSYIGQEVTITVTSILQTPAGRMIFGRVEPRSQPQQPGGSSAKHQALGPDAGSGSAKHAALGGEGGGSAKHPALGGDNRASG